tara:strand:- start:6950 stop:7558 length:609 start_codon:yes stop_codon:yes gene_type:complete
MQNEPTDQLSVDEVVDLIGKHQIEQREFWESLELIRWKFISVFGLGGIISLFGGDGIMPLAKSSSTVLWLFGSVISFAAIIVQIRICSVLDLTWHRITVLQNLKIAYLKNRMTEYSELPEHLAFPEAGNIHKQVIIHLFSVHSAVCGVFATLLGISLSELTGISTTMKTPMILGVAVAAWAIGFFAPIIIGSRIIKTSKIRD